VRVLIIDDSEMLRTLLGRMIRELGFEVIEAADGRAALAQLESLGAVELCLVDWSMPEMSGIEFIEAVRARTAWNPIKLVMITAATDMADVQCALEAGADEYLMKPFTREMIVEKLAIVGFEHNQAQAHRCVS